MDASEGLQRHYSIKSIVKLIICGYLSGVAITTVWFLNFPEVNSADSTNMRRWISWVVLGLLALILCYSRSVRCVLTLMVPMLCSSKGRSLLIAFAFILATTGPTLNIIENVDVLTSSISCGQTQLREALGNMLALMKQPLLSIKEVVIMALGKLRRVVNLVEQVLFKINELVIVVLASIKNAFDWLGNIVSVCNNKFGTPFERCIRLGDEAMETCRAKLHIMKSLCHATGLFKMLCYTMKFLDLICVLVDTFDNTVVDAITEKLQRLRNEIKQLFDVSITFDHDYYFKTVASKDLSDIGADILNEIHLRMKGILLVVSWLDLIGSLLLVSVVIKAVYFKSRFLRSPDYHNRYITKYFYEIDEQRKKANLEVALPLTPSEQKKYVQLTSFRLTRSELRKIARSSLFLIISFVQLFCICFVDYSLYWLLSMISYYGHKEAGLQVPPFITVNVEGGGFVGEIFQGIVQAFEPQNYTFDSKLCLPYPKTPDYGRYFHISGLCIIAWIFLIAQPYGLRVRHEIMRLYYPQETRKRAAWLYNNILIRRVSFFKFARRKARARYFKKTNYEHNEITFLKWLQANTNRWWICRCFLGESDTKFCIICLSSVNESSITCETIGCQGVYCQTCYENSTRVCCLCKNPADYGDLSDLSEVKESSEELRDVQVDEGNEYCYNNNNQ